MKLAIIGLPGSGKTTVFNALTRGHAAISTGGRGRDHNVGAVRVPDSRVDWLSAMYDPQKTIYAQVEYLDLGGFDDSDDKNRLIEDKLLNLMRPADALVIVARNFQLAGIGPNICKDITKVESDLIVADFMVVEKRLTKIEEEKKRGKKINEEEYVLLKQCAGTLENSSPLRSLEGVFSSPMLKGFSLLSAKPMLWVINSQESGSEQANPPQMSPNTMVCEICGKLEMELAQLTPEEAELFRGDLNLGSEPALNKLIRHSYELLGLISFFTVGKDEVRAWTINRGTPAQAAAGVIHTDIEKGFIRAEVLAYRDLVEFGSFVQAQKKGKVRLEGRDYTVQDGDIINFRFNI